MDKDMLRRAEEALDERRLQWSEEETEEEAMTGYRLSAADIFQLEEKYPQLMRKLDEEYWKSVRLAGHETNANS